MVGKTNTTLTVEQRRYIAITALKLTGEPRKQYLSVAAPSDFTGISDSAVRSKLCKWKNAEGRKSTFSNVVKRALIAELLGLIDDNGLVDLHSKGKTDQVREFINLDILRMMLGRLMAENGEEQMFLDNLYELEWAASFATKHHLPSFIASIVGTEFEASNNRFHLFVLCFTFY
jgi:uncharacterized membrane-anchored protein YjiN (DUF445 family)